MKLRAVIYARCSTEEESQKDALIKQVEEAKECVRQNGWIFVDSYVESRSGTTTKGRNEYNRLYEDLSKDRFDVIVIKSQDRLMRNTKDWYLFVDRLVSEQKRLYMYIDHKFYSTDDALITGIKAILAEEYSRELSKKINNAHKNRQQHNGTVLLTSHTYGYRKLKDKSVVIEEKEAVIIRRVYELCAAGFGSRTICTILQNKGIFNRNGNPFNDSSILRIIHNPLYKGTVVMNQRHFDFETKKTVKVPKEQQYIYEHKVPAIVSEELWELANQEISRRAMLKNIDNSFKIGRNRGKSQLSGKLFCGLCGNPYYRRTRRRYKDGTVIYEWKCKTYLETGRNTNTTDRPQIRKVHLEHFQGCDNVHLQENTLFTLLEEIASEKYQTDREEIVNSMLEMLQKVLQQKDFQPDIDRYQKVREKLMEQMNKLLDKLLEGIISNEVYRHKQKELESKLQETSEKLEELQRKSASGNVLRDRLHRIENTIRNGGIVEKATAASMLEEIDRIMVYPDFLEIHFSLSRMLGLDEKHEIPMEQPDNVLRIEYGHLFNYRKKKKDEREIIIEMMQAEPQITAKGIAEKLGISLSGANYKIKALKKEGRIYFQGKGGRGRWMVLDENDKTGCEIRKETL